MSQLVDDLRQQLSLGNALIVVGAGVSVGATGNAPEASWVGLLRNGVDAVEQVAQRGLPARWSEYVRHSIESGDLGWMLGAADDITMRLGGRDGGEYRRWLQESVGKLRVTDPSVIDALASLGAPIATTNYDDLLEEVTGLRPVTWRDGVGIQQALRRDRPAIVHLHGHWQDPQSVVLGIRSYEEALSDAAGQALQQAMATLKSLVFVGFGAGLADPNFGALRRWVSNRFPGATYRHFRLCRDSQFESVVAQHDPGERIMTIRYGNAHSDLAPFLRSLRPHSAAVAAREAMPTGTTSGGQDREVRESAAPPSAVTGDEGARTDEADPPTGRRPEREVLTTVEADHEDETSTAGQTGVSKAEPRGKYRTDARGVQGLQVGDHNEMTNTFGSPQPAPSATDS